jgi:starch-binding outer membrane protein SusE/F
VVISKNAIAPTILSLPNLTLERVNGTDTIIFNGTPVDPGFQASATYFLEACAPGNNFTDAIVLYSGSQDVAIKFTVSNLNGLLLQKFPGDKVSSIDFRIRSILTTDAGTGIEPFVYTSEITNSNVTLYGLPRLDLIGLNPVQKVQSSLGDGKYFCYVALTTSDVFTLVDPERNVVFGGNSGILTVNGASLTVSADGWYKFNVDTVEKTYTLTLANVGIIGDATGSWANDTPMSYDVQSGAWYITMDLIVGSIKFRQNNNWDGGINLGIGTGYSLDNLWNNSSSANIPIAAAGNYTIKLYIDSAPYHCTIKKN